MTGEVEIRPATEQLRRRFLQMIPRIVLLAAIFVFLVFFRAGSPGASIAVAAVLLTTALIGVIYVWLYFRNYRLAADGEEIRRTDAFGRSRTFRRDAVAKVLLQTRAGSAFSAPADLATFVALDGRRLWRLQGMYFREADVRRLVEHLQLPVEGDWRTT